MASTMVPEVLTLCSRFEEALEKAASAGLKTRKGVLNRLEKYLGEGKSCHASYEDLYETDYRGNPGSCPEGCLMTCLMDGGCGLRPVLINTLEETFSTAEHEGWKKYRILHTTRLSEGAARTLEKLRGVGPWYVG